MNEPPEEVQPAEISAAADEEVVICRNCGTPVALEYCGRCSQARDVHVPSTKELIHDALEGITHSDSRLWRTLRLLWFKPGALSEEYIAGRRMSYLPPFRLYLIVSVAYFFVASFTHNDVVVLSITDDNKANASQKGFTCEQVNMGAEMGLPQLDARLKRVCQDATSNNGAQLKHLMVGAVPKAMFLFLPLVAWLSMMFYRRPHYPFAVHWLFFLHLHAFFFSAALLTQVGDLLTLLSPALKFPNSLLKVVIFWTLLIYALFAARRVFKNGWLLTLAKGLGMAVVYFAVFTLMDVAVVIYAALEL
ncbi:MAG TPA: DUF3667 domain-containing protein [Steroidobacteraceae bacterium]|jgi:hypothetical protein